MKRRLIKRVERRPDPVSEQPVREEFYEAMPTTAGQPAYREGPVYREDTGDDRLFSGWAVLGVIILALVILLLLFGRSNITPSVNRSTTGGVTNPTTSQPVSSPTPR